MIREIRAVAVPCLVMSGAVPLPGAERNVYFNSSVESA